MKQSGKLLAHSHHLMFSDHRCCDHDRHRGVHLHHHRHRVRPLLLLLLPADPAAGVHGAGAQSEVGADGRGIFSGIFYNHFPRSLRNKIYNLQLQYADDGETYFLRTIYCFSNFADAVPALGGRGRPDRRLRPPRWN